MIGDILLKRIEELSNCSSNKKGKDAFWIKLRDIAVEEINSIYPERVSSDYLIPKYYEVLKKNVEYIPNKFRETLPSNKQERFRVVVRNLFVTNAFHSNGLAKQQSIKAIKQVNASRRGNRIIYQGVVDYDYK